MKSQGGGEKLSIIFRLRSEFSFIRGNFLLLLLSWIIIDFFDELSRTYSPLFIKALGGSAFIIGLIGSANRIASALVQFPGGYLADKYGRKRLITWMTLMLGCSHILYVIAPDWRMILLASIISGFCSIYGPALDAITMDSLPKERRGMGFSIINLITSVSTTPSPLIAGYLYLKLGLVPSVRLAYFLFFIALTVAGILRLKLRETVESSGRIVLSELLNSYPRAVIDSLRVWRTVPKSAFFLFISEVLMSFSFSMLDPILLLYLVDDLGITPSQWSYILTVISISMIMLAIPSGKIIDRIGKKIPLIFSNMLVAVILPLITYGNFTLLLAAAPFFSLSNLLAYAASSSLFADLTPREKRGKISGSRNFFGSMASSAGQFMGGLIYDKISHKSPFIMQYILIVPIIFLIFRWVVEPEVKED
ncbi:MAG: MFS transporter [archaeon GB-1845-036]|nr:MFS transporter [Candidatus Culexmicrobium thermophilum]